MRDSPLGRAGAPLALAALFLVAGGLVAYAQTGGGYNLTWWTVNGGGATGISGGQYTLLNTAGQPDAEVAISGGGYTLLSGFWPDQFITSTLYLPIVMKAPLPDLVGSFSLTPDKLTYSAGEPVLITAVITNVGTAAADAFWVDFYINPSRVPAVNLRWNDICGMTPCYGIAWYVSGGLAPGQSITLTSASYPAGYSIWPGYFAPGTSDLYLYVDMWNPPVPTGGVLESDETNNLAERHGLVVTGLGASDVDLPSAADLPPRPVRLGQ